MTHEPWTSASFRRPIQFRYDNDPTFPHKYFHFIYPMYVGKSNFFFILVILYAHIPKAILLIYKLNSTAIYVYILIMASVYVIRFTNVKCGALINAVNGRKVTQTQNNYLWITQTLVLCGTRTHST